MNTWTQTIEVAPPRDLEPWTTPEQYYREWSLHVDKRGAKNSRRNNKTYVGVFIRMFEKVPADLQSADIEAFMARMERKCSRLMLSDPPECRGHWFDIEQCPLLRGQTDYTSCKGYQPLDPAGQWSYICAINRFYEWLLEEGRIKHNPALKVMRDFASRYSSLFDERRRKPRRRNFKLEEIRSLVTGTPINHGIGYMLMAKCLIRIHEVLKLSFDPEFCNLEEGWMDIPMNWELGNKRKGNMRIILDAEAKRWVRQYKVWWDEHVKRGKDGKPLHHRFLITIFGNPWGKEAVHNYNTALQNDAIELGLMTGKETRRQDRTNSHAFRAFGTTAARDAGAQDADVQLIRGDLAPGSLERYDAYLRRLPELYAKYGPVLGI